MAFLNPNHCLSVDRSEASTSTGANGPKRNKRTDDEYPRTLRQETVTHPLSPSATAKILGKVNETTDKVDWSQAGRVGKAGR